MVEQLYRQSVFKTYSKTQNSQVSRIQSAFERYDLDMIERYDLDMIERYDLELKIIYLVVQQFQELL